MPRVTVTLKETQFCIFGSVLHTMNQVLNLYSLSRVASAPKPAVAHRSLPGMNTPWAGSGVIPLVCPACKPHVCPALSEEGRDSRCRAERPPSPAVARTALPWFTGALTQEGKAVTRTELRRCWLWQGLCPWQTVQRNDELETSPSSYPALISLQRLPPLHYRPALSKVSCDFVTF